jgi:neurofibromin 1
LDMTSSPSTDQDLSSHDGFKSPYMSLLLARLTQDDEIKDNLWFTGATPKISISAMAAARDTKNVSSLKDKDLLLNTAIELVDFQYLEDSLQNSTLKWLKDLSSARPTVIMHL